MSVSVMSKVMKHYQGAGGEYTLALCLADFANEMGDSIYPSVSTLAYNSRQSERTVQRQLRAMVAAKWLEISEMGGGSGKATRYRISRRWLADPESWAAEQPEGVRWRKPAAGHCADFVTVSAEKKGDTGVTVSPKKRVTNEHENGDTAVSPEQEQPPYIPPISPKAEDQVKPCATATDDPDAKADCELAEWMFGLIKAMHPGHKPPQWAEWRKAIRLMRVRDHRTRKEIGGLFRWANGHEFWASNILSPGKLRRKWDVLVIQRRKDGGQLHQQHDADDRNCIRCHEPTRGSRNVPGTGWLCNRHIDEHEGAGHV